MSVTWNKAQIAGQIEVPKANISSTFTADIIHNIPLPNQMSITINQPWNKLHAAGALATNNEVTSNAFVKAAQGGIKGGFNYGYERKIPTFTFSLTLPDLSEAVKLLRDLKESKVNFNISIFDAQIFEVASGVTSAKSEHKLLKDKLLNCRVTDISTSYDPGTLPMVRVNGMALKYEALSITSKGLDEIVSGDGSVADYTANLEVIADDVRDYDSDLKTSDIWG